MGSGASVPDVLDEAKAKELAGDKWNQEAFDAKKDADGNITKAQFEEQAANNTDTKVGQQLPANLDEINEDFITFALKVKGLIEENVKVVSFQKTKYGREKGYLGDKCLLENIKYEPEASTTTSPPNSIFVKMFPTDMVVPPGAIASMFKKSVDFLIRAKKELPDANDFKIPSIYFAEIEESDDTKLPPRCVILMEPIKGKPIDLLTSMPIEHAIQAVKDIAILHTPYWGFTKEQKDKTFPGYGHLDDPGAKQQTPGMFKMGSMMGLQVFGADGPLTDEQKKDFSGYIKFWSYFGQEIWPHLQTRWSAVMNRWASIPAALIHGDFHVENMFCMEDGSNVYFDFQALNFGPGVRDLVWLLTSSLTSEARKEHEKNIVQAYHEALVARGVKDYAWENCWEDYVFMKIDGLWRGMLGAGIFAVKNFKEKSGIFAPEPTEDAIVERKRNNLLFIQVVDDMKHSNWPDIIKALPVDD